MRGRVCWLVAITSQATGPVVLLAVPPPHQSSASATSCLTWSSAPTKWQPGCQSSASTCDPEGVCRVVSLENTPMSVSIGKVESEYCFYEAANSTVAWAPSTAFHNGTSAAGIGAEFAGVADFCTVNFTIQVSGSAAFPNNTVVAGFQSTGAALGVCLATNGEGKGSRIPGQVYLSGPERGQCCWNAGYKRLCMAGGYEVAVFHAASTVESAVPAQKEHGAGTAAVFPTRDPSAESCLRWVPAVKGKSPGWTPGNQGGDKDAPEAICRRISLESAPMGVRIGKSATDFWSQCFYTATDFSGPLRPATSDNRNGTASRGNFQLAQVSPRCRVNFTVVASDSTPIPSNHLIAGFDATGARLGICLVPDGEGASSLIPGQAYLSGERRGQCCFSAEYQEHCRSSGFELAVFYPGPPPPPPPPPPCGDPTKPTSPPCNCPHIDSTRPAPNCAPPSPAPCLPPSCDPRRFLGTDNTTQGAFKPQYGKLGFSLLGLGGNAGMAHVPAFVTAVSMSSGGRSGAWPALAAAEDPRALTGSSADYRELGFVATDAAPADANGSFTLTVEVNSSSAVRDYVLSLYLVDFAGDGCACLQADKIPCCGEPSLGAVCSRAASAGRIQRVAVRHAASHDGKLVAPEQILEKFEGGLYLRFNVSGSVKVEVSQVCAERGAGMINALMFDDISYDNKAGNDARPMRPRTHALKMDDVSNECGHEHQRLLPPLPSLPSSFRFVHPGVLLSNETLVELKHHAESGTEPWSSILAATRQGELARLNYSAKPRSTVECGSYDHPSFGCADERQDAAAAYIHALLFVASGDVKHASKSAQIMDAWSAVLVNHTNSNAPLQAAWAGSVFPRAAEIIRYRWGGWRASNIVRFEKMLTSAYLPLIISGCFGYNGNWELSMAEAIMAISVFTEDKASFATALELWRDRVPGYFYLSSDGPTPRAPRRHSHESKLAVVGNWHGQKIFAGHDGLCQETCRDLGHTQMGTAATINAAETAFHQGINLYGEQARRITAALEFHAQLVLPNATQPGLWLCNDSVKGIGHADPTWEIALNHYGNRLNFSNLSRTAAIVEVVRPTGVALHMVVESLSHGNSSSHILDSSIDLSFIGPRLLKSNDFGLLETDDEKLGPPPPKICDVTAHGARGDNSTDDTDAFVAAITACSGAAPTGRGVVVAPAPGRYLLKPLQLKNNVELQIRTGATLVLWPYGPSYPNYTTAQVRPGGEIPEAGCFNNPTGTFACVSSGCKQSAQHIPMSFLWGENISNVAIGGGGSIDGQGLAWWLKSWWKRRDLNMYWRPKLLEFPGATDLILGGPQGLRLVNSPMWNTALHRSTRLTVTNVTVYSPSQWINTDGINFSGEDIYVADCTVFNGDDCVPVFAASGPRGTRNVLVERVSCHGGTNAGIIVNCVHPSGSAQNLTFRNIMANGTMHGAGIKSCAASFPATITDVSFESITMTNVRQSKSGAIYVNAFSQDTDDDFHQRGETENWIAAATSYPSCGGEPQPGALLRVHNISFTDIAVSSPVTVVPGKFSCPDAAGACTGFFMRNVSVAGQGAFTCKNVLGSAGAHVTPVACFASAAHPPTPFSCCPLDPDRGPLIPWVREGNVSNAWCNPGDRSCASDGHGSPGKPLLGISPTEAHCRALCEKFPNCTQYVWDARPSRRVCIGRCDTHWSPHPTPPADNIVSARRVNVKMDDEINTRTIVVPDWRWEPKPAQIFQTCLRVPSPSGRWYNQSVTWFNDSRLLSVALPEGEPPAGGWPVMIDLLVIDYPIDGAPRGTNHPPGKPQCGLDGDRNPRTTETPLSQSCRQSAEKLCGNATGTFTTCRECYMRNMQLLRPACGGLGMERLEKDCPAPPPLSPSCEAALIPLCNFTRSLPGPAWHRNCSSCVASHQGRLSANYSMNGCPREMHNNISKIIVRIQMERDFCVSSSQHGGGGGGGGRMFHPGPHLRGFKPFASPQELAMGCSCINGSRFECSPPYDDDNHVRVLRCASFTTTSTNLLTIQPQAIYAMQGHPFVPVGGLWLVVAAP